MVPARRNREKYLKCKPAKPVAIRSALSSIVGR